LESIAPSGRAAINVRVNFLVPKSPHEGSHYNKRSENVVFSIWICEGKQANVTPDELAAPRNLHRRYTMESKQPAYFVSQLSGVQPNASSSPLYCGIGTKNSRTMRGFIAAFCGANIILPKTIMLLT
jgi:hypothetical protein